MRKIIFIFCLLASLAVQAQEESNISFDIELLSRHFWRGLQMGNSPAIEPNATYSFKGFKFSVWAAYTLNSSYTEIDLIPSYTIGNFEFIFYDYYNPVFGEDNKYLNFSGKNNRHSCEIVFGYNGEGYVPFRFMVGTFVFGDKNPITSNPYYSTYLEFAYPFQLKDVSAEVFAGLTPLKGFYADGLNVISSGLMLKTNVSLSNKLIMPLKFSYLVNPHSSKAFVIFGVGLSKI